MEINREKIEEIIEKILKELDKENKDENINIIFSYPWNNLYYLALEELRKVETPMNAIVSEEILGENLERIKKEVEWKNIIFFNNTTELDLKKIDKVIFLRLTRNNVIDIASMYSKNFETELIKKLISEGKEIFYWDKGLEKITGKEPVVYQKKLLKYYEEILEFGIYPIELKAVK